MSTCNTTKVGYVFHSEFALPAPLGQGQGTHLSRNSRCDSCANSLHIRLQHGSYQSPCSSRCSLDVSPVLEAAQSLGNQLTHSYNVVTRLNRYKLVKCHSHAACAMRQHFQCQLTETTKSMTAHSCFQALQPMMARRVQRNSAPPTLTISLHVAGVRET